MLQSQNTFSTWKLPLQIDPCLELIHSKVQYAAAIVDGTAQGIEGHVADPPKVLSSENDLDMSVDDDVDEDLAI